MYFESEHNHYMGDGTPSLCDVLPFEINNKKYNLLIDLIFTMLNNVLHRSVGVEQQCGSRIRALHGLHFLSSFVEFYECILG